MQRGNIDWTQLRQSARQGNANFGQAFGGGNPGNGECAIYDAFGNVVGAGYPPALLGPGPYPVGSSAIFDANGHLISGSGGGGGSGNLDWIIGSISAGHYAPNVTAGGNVFHQITLNANLTIDAPTGASTISILNFVFIQDATGGRTITWDATYEGVTIGTVDGTANTYSIFSFVLRKPDFRPILQGRPITALPWV